MTLREAMLPAKVSDWRAKLSTKAKQEKRFRFYSLYGLISHAETLKGAWNQVRANGGAAGVDRISIEQIERQGARAMARSPWSKNCERKTYRCAAVRRVYIPKANGKLRPLGIPTVRDRVVQAAVLLILEPIFEADFEECSYGFRPGRNAHQALEKIRENLRARKCEIYDADLEGYFDSIPHDKLMACVKMRVVDGSVLKLIKQWLKAPVQEEDQQGRKKIGRNRSGTPQGGVLSPLLANIYLHWFDRVFHSKGGPAQWAKATLIRYADDFVVMARYMSPQIRNFIEQKLEAWLGLKLNREKTRIVNLRRNQERLEFLGYQIGLAPVREDRSRHYWRMEPSHKAMEREVDRIWEMTARKYGWKPLPELIEELNRHLKGWANYYRLGQPRKAFQRLNRYVRQRLYQRLRRSSQRPWKPAPGQTAYGYFQQLGLIYL